MMDLNRGNGSSSSALRILSIGLVVSAVTLPLLAQQATASLFDGPLQDHVSGSAEFQAINSYLTALDPLSGDPKDVIRALNKALEFVESVRSDGLGNFLSSSQGGAQEPHVKAAIYNLLNSEQPDLLINVIQDLIKASCSCNQEATNFLLLVVRHQTFEGQFMNRYGRKLLAQCFQFNLDNLGRLVDRAVGKMDAHLFELIDQMATHVSNAKLKAKQRERKEIFISDQQPARDPRQLLQSLKELKVSTGQEMNLLAAAFLSIAADESSTQEKTKQKNAELLVKLRQKYLEELVRPCKDAVSRMDGPLSLLTEVHGQGFTQEKALSKAIQDRRETDLSLDYLLEISSICKRIIVKQATLWEAISRATRMRGSRLGL